LLSLVIDVQQTVLPLAQPLIPPEYWPWVSMGFSLLIVVLRNIRQPALHEGEQKK
jgi:hypothetical protein